MLRRVLLLVMMVSVTLVSCSRPTGPQEFPSRTVELVVPFPPGGATDLVARSLAGTLTEIMGQPVVVVNKAGAARLEGGQYVTQAKPDGYTVGLLGPSAAWPEVFFSQTPYTSKQVTLISRVTALPTVVVVSAKGSIQTWQDLVEYARTKPGLKYGHTGAGATPHLLMAALAKAEGLDMVAVPFSGDAGVAAAIVGGHVEVGASMLLGAMPQVEAGNERILVVHAPERIKLIPNVPTVDELGVEISLPYSDLAVCGPAGIPADITTKWEEALKKAIEHPSFQNAMARMGAPIAFLGHSDYEKDAERQKVVLSELLREVGAR